MSSPKVNNPIAMVLNEIILNDTQDNEFKRTIINTFKDLKEEMNKCQSEKQANRKN